MKKRVVLEKEVGQTPLECMEVWRERQGAAYQDVPLAYAGRLDPMASGKLLVLIGEECKQQQRYHRLDKQYEFSVLFGVSSDSGDVLGLVSECAVPELSEQKIRQATRSLADTIQLPYPKFSSKTVHGKPLHTWTLEGRLDEIEIPTYTTSIFSLKLNKLQTRTRREVYETATAKIETITPVTDAKKAIGNDFRRPDIRQSWQAFAQAADTDTFTIATFSCIATSGTYMRTLAEVIAQKLDACGLAYHIHRSKIGTYIPLPFGVGVWLKQY